MNLIISALLILLILALMVATSEPAQEVTPTPDAMETVYRDPQGRFSVPIPTNWTARPALKEALAQAGNEDETIEAVSGVNHLFVGADRPGASPAEWTELSDQIAPEVLDLAVSWLVEQIED